MDLRTKFNLKKSEYQLDHSGPLFLLGSCFSENIGNKLKQFKFDSLINPLGVSYNPLSIHKSFFEDNHTKWLNSNGVFFNYNYHSDLNGLSKKECELKYKKAFEKQSSFLKKTDTIFITYGTAWVYELVSNKQIVNNCHKQPSTLFNKRLLNQEEIVNSWKETMRKLCMQYKKDFNFIFTLSPIRHVKNGLHENQLSKSTLLLSINQICINFKNCSYFPSYELIIDDLRDYRFFEPNLTHPNKIAIDYVWEKMCDSFFSTETNKLNEQIRKITSAIKHKPFHPKTDQHQLFLKKIKKNILQIQKESKISFAEELTFIENQII